VSTSTGSHAVRRRRAASRTRARRRLFLGAVLAAIAAFVVVSLMPRAKDAVQELTLPLRHEDIIVQQSRAKGVPADLIAGVIYAESRFVDQTSHAGARGLMQITPDTAQAIATRTGGVNFRQEDLADPQINISYGTWYLRNLLDRYGDNVVLALAAYNAGQGNVDKWISAAQAKGEPLTIEAIPFAETRGYVTSVLQARADYRKKYPHELGLR
jgi:soluble lytic murein transglycosylase